MKSDDKGRLAELAFEAECVRRGIQISRPLLPCRYDYVMEVNGAFKRVQVKWADGRIAKNPGCVHVQLAKMSGKRSSKIGDKKYYLVSEVDLLIVYVPRIDRLLALEPPMFCGRSHLLIRIDEPKNGQRKKVRFASDIYW